MKKTLTAFALGVCAVVPVIAAPNVGVSIGINQPGVYGRIDIGNYPQPALVYAQPIIVAPPTVVIQRQPIYLYVPPAYQQNWTRYCGRYSACGQPVYFVQERWVRERWEHEHRNVRNEGRDRFEGRDDEDHHDNGRHLGHGKDKQDKHGKGGKHDD